MRWYVQQEADGTFTAVRQNADGSYSVLKSHVGQDEAQQAAAADQGMAAGSAAPQPAQPGQPGQPLGDTNWTKRQLPDGSWMTYLNNVPMNRAMSPAEADEYIAQHRASLSALGQGGGTPGAYGTPGYSPTSAAGGYGSAAGFDTGIWNALMQSNREQFDWQKANAREQRYGDLATALLGTAAQLRGPEDYWQYAQYTNGGRNLLKTLYGGQPVAAFGLPGGFSKPFDLGKMMQDLGLS